MRIGFKLIILAVGALCSLPLEAATSGENPYAPIVTRNMFGLVPIPVHNPADDVPATPLPKITPNGIMTIFGKVQVLFKVQANQPGQPVKEVSYTMGEGERQDEIEVQKIDEQAASITFDNHGTVQILELSKTVTPASAPTPAGLGGGPRVPAAMPSVAPSVAGGNPTPGIGFGGRFGRNRGNVANPTSGAASAGTPSTYGGNTSSGASPQVTEQISPEAQIIMMEAQRAKFLDEGNSAAAIIPPTPITDQVTGQDQAPQPAPSQ